MTHAGIIPFLRALGSPDGVTLAEAANRLRELCSLCSEHADSVRVIDEREALELPRGVVARFGLLCLQAGVHWAHELEERLAQEAAERHARPRVHGGWDHEGWDHEGWDPAEGGEERQHAQEDARAEGIED